MYDSILSTSSQFSAFSKKKILVVGGSGFIGLALTKSLLKLGAEVVCLGLTPQKDRFWKTKNLEHIVVDLFDAEGLQKTLSKYRFQYVFNLGGYVNHSPFFKDGRSVINTHFVGTLNLLEQINSKELLRYVHVGSSDEYGDNLAPQSEEKREAPIAPYSIAKVAATHLIEALAQNEAFPGVVARFFLVYGPGQNRERFIPFIVHCCLKGKKIPTSKGEQLRDFCYIEDIIEGLLLCALKKEAIGEIFNLASGVPTTIKSVVEFLISTIGSGKADFSAYPYRPGENMQLYADVRKAKRLLSWEPRTSLHEGLTKTVNWFQKQNN